MLIQYFILRKPRFFQPMFREKQHISDSDLRTFIIELERSSRMLAGHESSVNRNIIRGFYCILGLLCPSGRLQLL